jgi:hypothetical protein
VDGCGGGDICGAKGRDSWSLERAGRQRFDKGALGESAAVGRWTRIGPIILHLHDSYGNLFTDRVGGGAVYACRNTRGCGDIGPGGLVSFHIFL